METNFFQSLSALQLQGDWNITIQQTKTQSLIVSVLLKNESCGDEARKVIPPIILKGSAAEMDEGFFANITEPLKATAQLFLNMESYMKQQETAQLQSKMEKDKANKAEKEKSDKDKKYEAALKAADELEKAGKYREAWIKVPEPTDYPDYAEAIRKRKSELSAKFPPDLFGEPATISL